MRWWHLKIKNIANILMITIKSHGKEIVEISEDSIKMILTIYRDENLLGRKLFVDAISSKEMSYTDLRSECDKLLIP